MASTTIIILVLFFTQGSLGHVLQQSPIVGIAGGYPVNIEDAPFMAAVSEIERFSNTTYFKCGGSIIHEQFVLTAAHCVKSRFFPLIVRVGSSLPSDGKLYYVDKYIIHEHFHGGDEDARFDVGLLKLSQPLTLGSSVKIIELADETFNIPIGLTANVTGWGDTENILEPSSNLRQVSETVSPAVICRDIDDALQFCVTNYDGGPCDGDSGGPLTVGDRQIGIASKGSYCYYQSSVFVKVPAYLQWIHDKIKENLLQ